MKKLLFSMVLLLGAYQAVAAVNNLRMLKCSISRFHKRFNCTPKEQVEGKRWLSKASLTAALVTLAGIIGGISYAEIKREQNAARKAEFDSTVGRVPTWEAIKSKYDLKDNNWDKILIGVVFPRNDFNIGTTIAEIEKDLGSISLRAPEAALDIALSLPGMSSSAIIALRGLKARRLQYEESKPTGVRSSEPPLSVTPPVAPSPEPAAVRSGISEPPILVTPPMTPNPERTIPGRDLFGM